MCACAAHDHTISTIAQATGCVASSRACCGSCTRSQASRCGRRRRSCGSRGLPTTSATSPRSTTLVRGASAAGHGGTAGRGVHAHALPTQPGPPLPHTSPPRPWHGSVLPPCTTRGPPHACHSALLPHACRLHLPAHLCAQLQRDTVPRGQAPGAGCSRGALVGIQPADTDAAHV
jgi:hypothetical protein